MTTTKKSSRERISKWRQSLKERGGREIVVPLEKEAVDHLKKLQQYYEGMSYGGVVTLALNVLDKTKSLVKPDSILEKKGKGKAGKE